VTLCRRDSWEDNIKMKLIKHDVSVLAGFKWLTVGGSLESYCGKYTEHSGSTKTITPFLCLFVRYFLV